MRVTPPRCGLFANDFAFLHNCFLFCRKKFRIQKLLLVICCVTRILTRIKISKHNDYLNITVTGVTGVRQKKAEYAKLKRIYRKIENE